MEIEILKNQLADELYKLELADLYVPSPHQMEEYYKWLEHQHNVIINLTNQIKAYEKINDSIIDLVCH